MKQFADGSGKVWALSVNTTTVKDVRKELGFDLTGLGDKAVLNGLIGDTILLVDIVYVVCKEQADKEGISDIDFGRAMYGDAIDEATEALISEVIDFFPKGRRETLRTAFAKVMTAQAMMDQRAVKMLNSTEMDQMINSEIEKAFALPALNMEGKPGVSSSSTAESSEA